MKNESLEQISLLETLDHLLDRGVVITGHATISIGDIDLLYLGLNIVLANVDAIAGKQRKEIAD
ncbi:MAG TPA: gas vesicle protein [Thermoanaerobaculia bacterium]|nr:gas vesicle protein [Thermoanaerobaculia bacterium]